MSERKPIEVAIVGGGCAALTAALELTRPEQHGRYRVTVYQQGWRLGGKGASGRGRDGRIEEHGLHVWLGFYENAFRVMREVYAELGRDPARCPITTWRDAFVPAPHVGLAHRSAEGGWSFWSAVFPPLPGEPGEPLNDRQAIEHPFSVRGYLVRIAEVARTLFRVAYAPGQERTELDAGISTETGLIARARELASTGIGLLDAVIGLLGNQLAVVEQLLQLPDARVGGTTSLLLASIARSIDRLRPSRSDEPHRQRAAEVLEVAVAALAGTVREGLIDDPTGFDRLDTHDFADWLRMHGASRDAVESPFIRGLYSLMFAFEGGDSTRPRAAAGQALRGCLRMFFTYRGAFFWKMTAGMGDVVFAPIYEVLCTRGVEFRFFRRLVDVGLAPPGETNERFVESLDFLVQADVQDGGRYDPLVDVRGLPCWPAEPRWDQLVDAEEHRDDRRDFESFSDRRCVRRERLEVGRDFDFVVLGVSIGEIPHVCGQLVDRDDRWRRMTERLGTVATQALQLWLRHPLPELGWHRGSVTLTGFVSPFDTWADMTHLLPLEDWPTERAPRALAYFCNVLDERQFSDERSARGAVANHASTFARRALPELWPGIVDEEGTWRSDSVLAEFRRANVNPTDRYVLCLPGTPRDRISPLDRTYDNLTIAGDWTSCGLNLGCVEAAVMSGMLASHALSAMPALRDIVGYDHP